MREFQLEIKVEGMWLATVPSGDCETLYVAEKMMHDAGIKTRVVMLTTEREILPPAVVR